MIQITNYTNYIHLNLNSIQGMPGVLVETITINKANIVRYGIKEGGVYIDMCDGKRIFINPAHLDAEYNITTAPELETYIATLLGNV